MLLRMPLVDLGCHWSEAASSLPKLHRDLPWLGMMINDGPALLNCFSLRVWSDSPRTAVDRCLVLLKLA